MKEETALLINELAPRLELINNALHENKTAMTKLLNGGEDAE